MGWDCCQAANDLERYLLRKEPPAVGAVELAVKKLREPERTCHMTLKKFGPLYVVWHFDCCDKEWAESRFDNSVPDYPGIVCPYCGAKVVE